MKYLCEKCHHIFFKNMKYNEEICQKCKKKPFNKPPKVIIYFDHSGFYFKSTKTIDKVKKVIKSVFNESTLDEKLNYFKTLYTYTYSFEFPKTVTYKDQEIDIENINYFSLLENL